MVDGLQVPNIPFVELVGRAVGVVFWQNGPIEAKVGVTGLVTVIVGVLVI